MWGFWFWSSDFTFYLNSLDLDLITPEKNNKEITMSQIAKKFLDNNEIYAVALKDFNYRDLGTFDDINKYILESQRLKNEI